ncbi:PTS sugar transporter subunit IIA [Saccharibacillus sp. O23]|uniref:PTS sugar transporter subunit IIA n=1 Tax=Saccharibacillus sp. O23 TaxID=2009338 RepID=UPI000B4E2C71|nr:PTS sugar transporter subunit IIA [Saccharibacillus sp. O23]OWR32640.1 PTS sugar transporter subunit IIA [Saccharibacillus sp. O23]
MLFLEKGLVALDIEPDSAEDAIRAAGKLLVGRQAAGGEYVEAMVAAYREKGPYIVIAPGIALPHAKAESEETKAAVSFARLKRPIVFGHADNDPVDLVFALASSSGSEHIALLKRLTMLLNDPGSAEALRTAKTAEDVEKLARQASI